MQRSIDGIIPPQPDDMTKKKSFNYSKYYKRTLASLAVLLLIVGLSFCAVYIYRDIFVTPDPIPSTIRKSVNFTVYYPGSKKLPVGYTLDARSISASKNAVILSVNYGHNDQIVFTEQPLPSNTDLLTFYAQRIPLRNNLTTPVGQAAISALNNQTFVSLPADKTWIIITAPDNINQAQLKQVLMSITQG